MEKEATKKLSDKAILYSAQPALLEKEKNKQISFSIRLADRLYFVAVDSIAFIYLEDNKVYLVDFKGDKHVISKTLESLEKAISAHQFYRVNRQMIVNREAIKDVEIHVNQRIAVHLTVPPPEKTVVPRFKVKPFLSWMEKG